MKAIIKQFFLHGVGNRFFLFRLFSDFIDSDLYLKGYILVLSSHIYLMYQVWDYSNYYDTEKNLIYLFFDWVNSNF